jgi:hypothetical protein
MAAKSRFEASALRVGKLSYAGLTKGLTRKLPCLAHASNQWMVGRESRSDGSKRECRAAQFQLRKNTDMRTELGHVSACAAALATLLVSWSAHAANPVADEKIAVAQAALQRAEQSGAPQTAPVEMATARDKLARAQKANADRDIKTASALADQANLDAQVAEAAAVQQHSHAAAVEFDASMQALRAEAMRATAPAVTTPAQ